MSQPEKIEPANKSLREPAEPLPELRETGLEKSAVAAPEPDYVVGRYRLDRQIGEGGMSVVYKAFDTTLNRDVAVKRLHTTKLGGALARFQQEARAAAKLQSKHIVSIFDFGTEDDGTPYLVMECIDGVPLSDLIKQGIDWKTACKIVSQVCDALQQAHSAGVVHRDIKPSNILITSNQSGSYFARVVDFGIARLEESAQSLTQTGEVFGSPLYMSPEQATGKRVDSRTDIYSLGCVLFEALAGHPPFEGASSLETLMMHQTEPTPRIQSRNVPNNLMDLIEAMLQKDPQLRPASCSIIAEGLTSIIENPAEGVKANSIGKAAKPFAPGNERSIVDASIAASVLLLVLAVGGFMYLKPPNVAPQKSIDVDQVGINKKGGTGKVKLPDPELTEQLNAVRTNVHAGNTPSAIEVCRKALARTQDHGTLLQRAEALQLYASLLTSPEFAADPNALKEAEKASLESVKLVEGEGLTNGPSYVYHLMTLANVLNLRAQHRDAIDLANRSLKLVKQSEDSTGYQAGDIYHSLGKYWTDYGDYGAAKQNFAAALKIFKPIDTAKKDMALVHSQLAQMFIKQGNLTDALPELDKAIALYEGMVLTKSDGYKMLANAYLDKGRFLRRLAKKSQGKEIEQQKLREDSITYFEKALNVSSNEVQQFSSLRELSKSAIDSGNYDKAESYLQQAFEGCDKFPVRVRKDHQADILKAMIKNYDKWGKPELKKKAEFRLAHLTAGSAYN